MDAMIDVEIVWGPCDGQRITIIGLNRIRCLAPAPLFDDRVDPPPKSWIFYDRTDETTVDGRVIYRYSGG